jgi:hypothetical protein
LCQTYKIAICDDLATDRNYLSSLCEIWGSHNSYRIQISEFTSAENFLFHYAEKKACYSDSFHGSRPDRLLCNGNYLVYGCI